VRLDVVTPKGSLLSTDGVEEVTAPGILGEFGVLPGHVPLLTGIRPGVVRWRGGGEAGVLAVGTGFAEVSNDRIVVLCDVGERADDIDVHAARKELAETQRRLDHWDSDDQGARASIEAQRHWAQARIEAAGDGALPAAH
jgi:F-type H+-transporting ATPase subunit epsilon